MGVCVMVAVSVAMSLPRVLAEELRVVLPGTVKDPEPHGCTEDFCESFVLEAR